MPRPKRTNKPLPQLQHRATGRAKRGITASVARVVAQNTPTIELKIDQLPIADHDLFRQCRVAAYKTLVAL